MAKVLSDDGVSSEEGRHDRLTVRPIAGGEDWSVSEFICAAGPGDRPFEELHDGYTIAAVVEGSFTYRADSGVALMHPGALLLGNSGKCFECGHEHGAGDRCISFNFSPELFCEITAAVAGTSRYKFSGPMLPAGKRSIPVLALIDAIARDAAPLHVEEVANSTGRDGRLRLFGSRSFTDAALRTRDPSHRGRSSTHRGSRRRASRSRRFGRARECEQISLPSHFSPCDRNDALPIPADRENAEGGCRLGRLVGHGLVDRARERLRRSVDVQRSLSQHFRRYPDRIPICVRRYGASASLHRPRTAAVSSRRTASG